jgi:hypothetical protein
MININRTYETRCGFPVMLLAIIDKQYTVDPYPVIGLYKDEDGDWERGTWSDKGYFNIADADMGMPLDLIEIGDEPPVVPVGVQVPNFGAEAWVELATASEASLQAWDRFLVPPAASA